MDVRICEPFKKNNPSVISYLLQVLATISERLTQKRVSFPEGTALEPKEELYLIFSSGIQATARAVKSRLKLTFPDIITRDAGNGARDLHMAMADGEVWQDVVRGVLAESKDNDE